MRIFFITIFVFLLLFSIVSCKKQNISVLNDLTKDNITGKNLWEKITIYDHFDKWSYWPGHEGLQLGQTPHGIYHEIYINKILKESFPIKSKIVPNGTIIVKENFNANKELTNYTVMTKIKDYDPENNDWFWGMYSSKGEILAEGKVGMCINCHAGMNDNDYIIVKMLNEE